MRGRSLFRIAKAPLWLFTTILYLFPRIVVIHLWGWLDGIPGHLGAGLRYALAKRLAKQLGEVVLFGEYVEIRGWQDLAIGNNVSIQRQCYLDASGGVTIGNDVSIAHASSIVSFDHTWSDSTVPIRENPHSYRSIDIGDDVWIGCGVRILAGSKIAKRSVIAAGAVVRGKHDPGSLLAGMPAQVTRSLSDRGLGSPES